MATLNLGEPVLDAVIAKLAAGLEARVAAINAKTSDDWTITPVQPHAIYFGGVDAIPQAPALIVFQLPSDGEHEAEGPHSFVWLSDVGVAVVEEDYDRQRLARKLMRQIKAVVEVLWDDEPREALADGAFHLQFIRDDPGPVQTPEHEGMSWRAMHVAVFRVRSHEG